MDINNALEILGFCATLLGCTWKLSGQLSRIENIAKSTKLDLRDHIKEDDRRFEKIHERIDGLSSPPAGLRRA